MERRNVHFSGHVQGVGFRFTVCRLARERGASGYVQNLPDGRVRMVVEGDTAEVDRLVAVVEARMADYITEMQSDTLDATGEFHGFNTRF